MRYFINKQNDDVAIWAMREDGMEKLIYRTYFRGGGNKADDDEWVDPLGGERYGRRITEEQGYVEISKEEAFIEML